MSPRVRKFIGLFGILAFLIAYAVAASLLSDHLPDHWLVRLVYYAVVGTAWGIPLLPFIRWMNRER